MRKKLSVLSFIVFLGTVVLSIAANANVYGQQGPSTTSITSTTSIIGSFLPLIILAIPYAFFIKSIAKRKGKNWWLWFFLSFVPVINIFGILWLVSLPEQSLTDDIHALITELQKFNFVSKASCVDRKSTISETWRCDCGKINNLKERNCSNCGLKRDYLLTKKYSGQESQPKKEG